MEDKLVSQSILISGGSRGLGQAISAALLEDGHRVASFSRQRSDFIDQAERDHDERIFYEEIDASDSSALAEFVRSAHAHFGGIDALINNAGVAYDGVLALANEDDLQRMLDVNLKAAMILSKEVSRYLLAQRHGVILNIASIIALRGYSGLVGYAATKAGLVGMTRALAREIGSRNVRVNAIAPGYLETDMSAGLSDEQRQQIIRRTPLNRLGRTEDVVPWVRFLLSDEAAFVTGQVIVVDGGASV